MTVRSLALLGLSIALLAAFMTGSAAAQRPIVIPTPQPPIALPIVFPCTQIASFSPASARPGEDVDIHLRPPAGQTFHGYTVTGVQFANSASTTFTNVAPHHVRAKVPLGSTSGPVRVTCRITVTGGISSATSATSFTPSSFGLTFNPTPLNVVVGTSATATATLSHPAPAPIALTLAPQNTSLSVLGLPAGASGTVTIATGQQSASFSVGAHLAAQLGGNITVSGPNVTTSNLAVTVPTPNFTMSVPEPDAEANWGDSASYSVELESHNGFAGTVSLSATGLPFGATPAPVSVNVPANGTTTATFSVATAQSATELGSGSFTLRGQSPGTTTRTRSLDLRVLPDEGEFGTLTWLMSSSNCGNLSATVNGANVNFTGPGFNESHPHYQYAWTPDCRGAVVMGPAAPMNAGWPVSIFNFGFDIAIADAPGSRLNLGVAAWNHTQFKVSPDGSFLVGVAQDNNFDANLYDMLELAQRPAGRSYGLTASLRVELEPGENVITADASTGNDWTWTLP